VHPAVAFDFIVNKSPSSSSSEKPLEPTPTTGQSETAPSTKTNLSGEHQASIQSNTPPTEPGNEAGNEILQASFRTNNSGTPEIEPIIEGNSPDNSTNVTITFHTNRPGVWVVR